jgi:HAD superfamily hydrolase (TIGR01549 family)
VDSRQKNFNVTRAIIEEITGQPASAFDTLESLDHYSAGVLRTVNWREFYGDAFGLSETEIDRAGTLWADYQLADDTVSTAFPGIAETLARLDALPHGIVSQNSRANIAAILQANNLADHFSVIIGYEEVDLKQQKPAPEGLLQCLRELTDWQPSRAFYIGDHVTDTQCVAEARVVLAERRIGVELVSVAAFYGAEPSEPWPITPDYIARHPCDIVEIIGNAAGNDP